MSEYCEGSLALNQGTVPSAQGSTLSKVVVRMLGGEVVNGFARRNSLGREFIVLDRQAREQPFELSGVKAVFFVKDFQGNPAYRELRFLNKQAASRAVWVRVRFQDGEFLEGKVQNGLELLTGDGFFLWPSDPGGNNDCAYIAKAAVAAFEILSAD